MSLDYRPNQYLTRQIISEKVVTEASTNDRSREAFGADDYW
jgi:hypothetical protein